jgi:hypothetical protein
MTTEVILGLALELLSKSDQLIELGNAIGSVAKDLQKHATDADVETASLASKNLNSSVDQAIKERKERESK